MFLDGNIQLPGLIWCDCRTKRVSDKWARKTILVLGRQMATAQFPTKLQFVSFNFVSIATLCQINHRFAISTTE